MPARTVSAQKIRNVITLHALSDPSYRELSRLFDVSSTTVGKYLLAFERSALSLANTRCLSDQALIAVLSPASPVQQPSRRHRTLLGLFPAIHQSPSDPTTSLLDQWKRYRRQQPHGLLAAAWPQARTWPSWATSLRRPAACTRSRRSRAGGFRWSPIAPTSRSQA